jgi:hypothetical protein
LCSSSAFSFELSILTAILEFHLFRLQVKFVHQFVQRLPVSFDISFGRVGHHLVQQMQCRESQRRSRSALILDLIHINSASSYDALRPSRSHSPLCFPDSQTHTPKFGLALRLDSPLEATAILNPDLTPNPKTGSNVPSRQATPRQAKPRTFPSLPLDDLILPGLASRQRSRISFWFAAIRSNLSNRLCIARAARRSQVCVGAGVEA